MSEIIPSNFATDKATFEKKLNILSFSPKIHLDFMDGKFTQMRSIGFSEMGGVKGFDQEFAVHLMAFEPQKYIEEIKELGIRKAFIHYEAFGRETELVSAIRKFRAEGLEIGLVLNPRTSVEKVFPFLSETGSVLLMSVEPGKEGQSFIEATYEKIRVLRRRFPDILIQVDGGINEANAKKVKEVGADLLTVGSYISSSNSPKERFDRLSSLVS